MIYEIKSKSDFSAGASLVIRIPEQDIDHKALQTLLADPPDFLLPFRCKSVDNEIELTYHVGTLSKLVHLSGSRSASEYAELWAGVLNPLLTCDDWFMNPYCFLLKTEYLFIDKRTQNLSYLYIPSRQGCSDYSALTEMVKEISKQNPVTDTDLQNKVLWAIMDDFNPKEFLRMMKPYERQSAAKSTAPPASPGVVRSAPEPAPASQEKAVKNQPVAAKAAEPAPNSDPVQVSDDLLIDLSGAGKKSGKEKPVKEKPIKEKPVKEKGKGLFGGKKEKEVKQKTSGGLFGKKKVEQEILIGAGAPGAIKSAPEPVGTLSYVQSNMPLSDSPVTELDEIASDGVKLRYIGNGTHPKQIELAIPEGASFSIGRYDITIGRPQSNFEFDQSTKAVSRRHAIIERHANGYQIIDLSSAAGTFVNGQRLLPNTPFQLSHGCRISFGNAGADYQLDQLDQRDAGPNALCG